MSASLLRRRHFLAAALGAVPAFTQTANRRILVITDGEGVAGICRQEQVEPTNPELRTALTGEANAAVEGFLAGGASEVVVWDGHDGSRTLSALTIHPKAKLIIAMSANGSTPGWNLGLDQGRYAAIAFVGQHAMGNVARGIMAHSFNSLGIQTMKLNGKPVGEIGIWTAISGHYGVPVIFLSGDTAAVDEMKALVPGTETVSVKEGIGRYACISMSAEAAREAIREGTRKAMTRLASIPPYRLPGPATLEIEYTTRNSINPDLAQLPDVKVLDDRTIRYHGPDVPGVWRRYRLR